MYSSQFSPFEKPISFIPIEYGNYPKTAKICQVFARMKSIWNIKKFVSIITQPNDWNEKKSSSRFLLFLQLETCLFSLFVWYKQQNSKRAAQLNAQAKRIAYYLCNNIYNNIQSRIILFCFLLHKHKAPLFGSRIQLVLLNLKWSFISIKICFVK